jgi:hypothetical protein
MAFGTTTYSGMGVTGAINSPYAGPFILAGAFLGRGKITVTMEHEWTEDDLSVDVLDYREWLRLNVSRPHP